MTRVTIRKHHEQYIANLAAQMGTDASTALDFILWNVKMQGFSFSSPLAPSVPALQPLASTGMFVPFQEVSAQTTPTADQQQDDEIVLKFAQLLEEF